ncbi:dicarboxylate/amino acid:cation symporter [Flavobacterium sp. TSSA_36]|uniref:dicarboxylate/amino acid:cation symporter n=1 Tax=Flavobacterium sp. TSSA_36 TaxID=3447669 RepID=UPI003F3C1AA7
MEDNHPGSFLENYSSILKLIAGIIIGSIAGLVFGKDVEFIKPLGDIFLNLLFTAIIPLVIFTIASSIANLQKSDKLGKLFRVVFLIFMFTVIVSAIIIVLAMMAFPIDTSAFASQLKPDTALYSSSESPIALLFTVNDFFEILSRKNMLALILFSLLIGFATLRAGEKGKEFARFLDASNEVMKEVLNLIMKTAPVGLGAYFAYQVGIFGPQLFGAYAKPLAVYYGVCILYFVIFFSIYAYMSGGKLAVNTFWKNNITASVTALGTCSSIATMPANLKAAEQMKIPAYIRNLVIPLGAPIHKDGSSMSSIVKIVVMFAIFGKDFMDPFTILSMIGITIIVSVVEGGIPNGGYIGEILAITVYGFPMEQALPAAMIIGTLVDPIATLLNANGDIVASMMVTRIVEGKNWILRQNENV